MICCSSCRRVTLLNLVGICDTSRGVREKEIEDCERRNEFDYGNDRDCIIQVFFSRLFYHLIDVYDYPWCVRRTSNGYSERFAFIVSIDKTVIEFLREALEIWIGATRKSSSRVIRYKKERGRVPSTLRSDRVPSLWCNLTEHETPPFIASADRSCVKEGKRTLPIVYMCVYASSKHYSLENKSIRLKFSFSRYS